MDFRINIEQGTGLGAMTFEKADTIESVARTFFK